MSSDNLEDNSYKLNYYNPNFKKKSKSKNKHTVSSLIPDLIIIYM